MIELLIKFVRRKDIEETCSAIGMEVKQAIHQLQEMEARTGLKLMTCVDGRYRPTVDAHTYVEGILPAMDRVDALEDQIARAGRGRLTECSGVD